MAEFGTGRLVQFDERSRLFPMSAALTSTSLINRRWRRPSAYNQGTTSACVGYSTFGLVNSQPNRSFVPYGVRNAYSPMDIYRGAQEIDPWPGAEPEYYGTSVLAGMKFAASKGMISTYRWCFGIDDVLRTLSHYGPVVIGIEWYGSMNVQPNYDPERYNAVALTVDTNSGLVGGHAVELHGILTGKRLVIGTNSWGSLWGDEGRFYLNWDDLDMLLQRDGEAVAATNA